MKYVIAAMYKFIKLDDYEKMREPLLNKMLELNVKGTLLLANEGINGTVSGTRYSIDKLLEFLKTDKRLNDIEHKESYADEHAFYRTKVKLKNEIVTMGVEDIDPDKEAGTYLNPAEWNKLLDDPEVILIDTRNEYEVKVGSFNGAVNPELKSFREFPKWISENLDKGKHKKVAMFCTGGIRCEKSTSYLNKLGFDKVYHLKGGILKYFEEIRKSESKWEGECFVFDQRVSVDQDLKKGKYDQCYACRMPITEEEKKSDKYEFGVSCHHCYGKQTEKQKSGFTERAKQLRLAREKDIMYIFDGKAVNI